MPIKPPITRDWDLVRARQIERSWTPLKRLSATEAEVVTRAIAQGIAEGRKQGLEMAKGDLVHHAPDRVAPGPLRSIEA
jgi:hypothetical protein